MQRRNYLSFLPALFKRHGFDAEASGLAPGRAASFLDAYLSVWQALLTDPEPPRAADGTPLWQPVAPRASLGATIQALPGLFHPRLSPAFLPDDPRFLPPLDAPKPASGAAPGAAVAISPEDSARTALMRLLGVTDLDAWLTTYLEWYGQMLDTPVPRGWALDSKRDLLGTVLPIYRLRGTLGGLRQLLELLVRGEQESPAPHERASEPDATPVASATGAPAQITLAVGVGASEQHLNDLVQQAASEPDARLFLEGRIRALYGQLYGPDPGSLQEVMARLQARTPAASAPTPAVSAPSTGASLLAAKATNSADALGLPRLVPPTPPGAKAPPLVDVLDGARGHRGVFRLNRSRLLPAQPPQELDGFEVGQFEVVVTEPSRQIRRLLRIERWLTRVVDTEKPFGTRFRLRLRTPTLVVGDSHIGIDTVLGDARVTAPQTSTQGAS